MFSQIITYASLLFLVLGAVDAILGNRLGLGKEFEQGILSSGRLLLCMAGFMVLAPAIARGLSPVISPAFRAVGADPSLFAGTILAGDSGGSVLAAQMADSEQDGLFNGLIVSSMLGATVMFNIPMTLQSAPSERRRPAIYGLLIGILTIPVGCLAGGIAGGFPLALLLRNTLPVLGLSILLGLLLAFFSEKVVPFFQGLGKLVLAVSTAGLTLGAIQSMTGVQLVAGMDTLEEPFIVVGEICLFLAGMFPFMAFLRRLLRRQFAAAGRGLRINQPAVSGLLVTLVNALPMFPLLPEMDDRGSMLNTAFLVSASCVFGDHLAYTSQVAPGLTGALIVGKLAGGVSAVLLSLALYPRLMRTSQPS